MKYKHYLNKIYVNITYLNCTRTLHTLHTTIKYIYDARITRKRGTDTLRPPIEDHSCPPTKTLAPRWLEPSFPSQ